MSDIYRGYCYDLVRKNYLCREPSLVEMAQGRYEGSLSVLLAMGHSESELMDIFNEEQSRAEADVLRFIKEEAFNQRGR